MSAAAARLLMDGIRNDRREVLVFLTMMVRVGEIGAGEVAALTMGALGQAKAHHVDAIHGAAATRCRGG